MCIRDRHKAETQIVEKNATRLFTGPLDVENNYDLQKLLHNLDDIGKTDNQLWKEITDQAMWLGNSMDPTGGIEDETYT